MFGQRFAYVFFPVQRQKFILRALEDSKALILGTGLISAFTQASFNLHSHDK
jgi:hypothetical protein